MFCYTVHMSTERKNLVQQRFALLARMGEILFHAHDLANLWDIKNPNTLYTTLKRYTQAELLFRVYKGFYSIYPASKIDPFLLGIKAMHRYSYVSTETILFKEGIINQKINAITLVSSISCKFKIGNTFFKTRQMKDGILFNQSGIVNNNNILTATIDRAVADMLYFNPKMYFDSSSQIDWEEVEKIKKAVRY